MAGLLAESQIMGAGIGKLIYAQRRKEIDIKVLIYGRRIKEKG
jgi:hypothetical protein